MQENTSTLEIEDNYQRERNNGLKVYNSTTEGIQNVQKTIQAQDEELNNFIEEVIELNNVDINNTFENVIQQLDKPIQSRFVINIQNIQKLGVS